MDKYLSESFPAGEYLDSYEGGSGPWIRLAAMRREGYERGEM